MSNNISTTDRIIRFLLFVAAITLFMLNIISGWLAYTLIAVGTVFLLTSLLSFCPIYRALGISTFKAKKQNIKEN